MNRRLIAVVMLSMLMLNVAALVFNVRRVNAAGTIYIHADGSIEPTGAPIITSDKMIYLLVNNTFNSIIIERSNIMFHGNGHIVQGGGGGVGVNLTSVSNVTIEDTIIVNFAVGIYLGSSMPKNSILVNTMIHNQEGIYVEFSNNSVISGNNVINSTSTGIYLKSSANDTISENTLETNYAGIQVESASSNRFYHNNFIYNSYAQVIVNASSNAWDGGYPCCGNYWSDKTEPTDTFSGPCQNETGADGVVDESYVIAEFTNVDHYPLMNLWTSNFTILNHMVVGRSGGPLTLDPAEAYDTASAEVIMNVYEPLIFFDEEKTDQFVPRLATSWEISPDGLTYTFEIRQGVKFHNNETLTPEDVEYSLERIFVIGDPRAQASWMLYEAFFNVSASRDEYGNLTVTGQQIDNAITRDDTSVILHLTRPYSPLMQILAESSASILCKKWCVQIGDWPGTWNNWTLYNNFYCDLTTAIEAQGTDSPGPHTNAMCGTGPFMFDYYDAQVEWQLVRFDGYWGGWPSNGSGGILKRVTGKIVVDWETRKDMFLDGQLDTLAVPTTRVGEVLGQPGVQSIYPLQQLECYALFFNFNISTTSTFMGVPGGLPKGMLNQSGIPPDFFTDVNVRKGFAYAFNCSQLIAEALNGEAFQPATPIIPGLPYYNPTQEKYDINLTKAIQCFSVAWGGQLWSSGFNFTICYNLGSTIRQKACEIIKTNVESLNSKFHIQIHPLSWIDYWHSVTSNHTLPIFDLGWLADFADPHDFAEGFMYSGTSGAFAALQSYSNSTIDALVQQGINTTNETARRQTYYALQSAYHDDCPSVPTYQPLGRRFQRDWVQGWYFNPLFYGDYFYTEWKGGIPNPTRYSWPMFHHDPTHTGYTESPAPTTNQLRWNYTTDAPVESSPAVADGKVYVGSDDGEVYCLDAATGTQVWNYTTGDYVTSSPAVAYGKVYVGSWDDRVYCLDAATGTLVWNYTTGDSVFSSPVVAAGKVYVGSDDGKVYCLDAATGTLVWNYTTGYGVFSSAVVVADKVYVGSGDSKTYCLDAVTGALVWNYTTGDYVASSPAVAYGKVYVGSDDGEVYCLDAATGTLVWNYTTGTQMGNYTTGDAVFSSPAVADGKVYVGSGNSKTYCLDAVTGALVWNYTTGAWVDSSPAVADGRVYVGSDDGEVYCLDAATGIRMWNYTTGDYVASSPAVVDGVVYVGSGDGHVYAFGNVIRVPEDYGTVQEAINAASPGATVWIAPGIYYESLVINKTITLIGKPGSEPTFNGGGSGTAIRIVSSGSGSTIAGITITSWDQGIIVDGAGGCQIYDNMMYLINNNGIVLQGTGAVNNQIYSNIFETDAIAVDVTSSSCNNVISQNIISLSDVGLKLDTNGNTICGNMISENTFGINMVNSDCNTIYHNDFVDNSQAVQLSFSASAGNKWDNGYPSGGNYWSAYNCVDLKIGPYQNITSGAGTGDGICDTHYTIAVNNTDNYPLAKPFNEHSIGIAAFTVGKTVICQGYVGNMTLSVLNYGLYGETFNATMWANQLRIYLQTVVLTSRSGTQITFTWNTTFVPFGNYTISSQVDTVPEATSNAGHSQTSGWIIVSMVGDVTGQNGWPDGIVNMRDIGYVARHFLTDPSTPPWDPNADINNDGVVNMKDVGITARHFLDHYP